MKHSLLSPPHECAGELCSCSIVCTAECSYLGDILFTEDLDDEFISQLDAAQQRKSCSVDVQLEERGSIEASDTCNRKEIGEDQSEQGFRESFYSSGTDWSSLYCVDEYGIPCESSDLVSMNLHSKQSAGLDGQGKAEDHLILCEVQAADKEAENSLLKSIPSFKMASCESSHGKLVQSSLSSCWGRKFQKISDGPTVVEAKVHKFDKGATMNEAAMIRPSHIWGKFKHPSALSISNSQPAVKNLTVSKLGAPAQGKPMTRRKCPFYKKIPGTSFTVDAFQYGAVEDCKAYFLTHFHSDHYGGLTKSWAHGPIYCTPITARLLTLCLYVDEKWIHPLRLGTSHFIDGVEVKMLDANHCPGAAIIHFRLKNGQAILHTGDFRACKTMQDYPELIKGCVHTLYLDTTYCNQRYRFPLQKDVINFVVEVTCSALKKNKRTLVVVGAYSIGKERVYLGIAEALNVPIFAESRRSRILGALEWPELVSKLTRDADSTCLHVLPIGHLRPQKLRAYLQSFPKYNMILAFRPTGWTYSEKIGNELHLLKPTVSGTVTIYGVPYSEHSSFTELQEFVQFLQPELVIPTVNVGNPQTRDRMKSYFRHWLRK